MITQRARRPSDRNRHVPLHRRRGLDEAPTRARRGGVRRGSSGAPAHDPRGLRAEGGVEVDTQGDAFFFAFPTAPWRACCGGCAFTEALSSGPIRVRVGVHTGTPFLTEEGYVGGMCIAPRASPRRATAAKCSSPPRRLSSSTSSLLISASIDSRICLLPERIYQLGDGDVPCAQVALPHEPAHPCNTLPRTRAGAR